MCYLGGIWRRLELLERIYGRFPSVRGVNFGFWSHLGCTGQNAIIFSREGLHVKKYENIYLICIFLMGHSYNPSFLMCLCFNMVFFRGKKKLGPRPDRSPLGLKFKISD